jgi:hypothetical protein
MKRRILSTGKQRPLRQTKQKKNIFINMAVNFDFDDEEKLSAWARGEISENDDQFAISVEEATKKPHKRTKRKLPPPILTPTQERFQYLESKEQARTFDLEEFKTTLKNIANNVKTQEQNNTDKYFLTHWLKAVRGMLSVKKLGHQVKDLVFIDNFLKLFWNESLNPTLSIHK